MEFLHKKKSGFLCDIVKSNPNMGLLQNYIPQYVVSNILFRFTRGLTLLPFKIDILTLQVLPHL